MQHSFNIEIAKEHGLLEAIIINNLFFWIEKNKANNVNYYDGTYWTYNSIKALNELFPYASERKISYALKHLEEEGIIKTGNYNKLAQDRTLWYAFTEKGISILQKCCLHFTKSTNAFYKSDEPIPDINTDINTNINTDNNIKENIKEIEVSHSAKAEQCDIPYEDIISYLNFKAGTNFRSNTNKTKSLIKARFNEGFTVEEFKVVIDKKCIEWLNNKDMSKYLRPETLFGTKFEGYLNQKNTTKKETKSNKQLEFLKGVYNGTIKID